MRSGATEHAAYEAHHGIGKVAACVLVGMMTIAAQAQIPQSPSSQLAQLKPLHLETALGQPGAPRAAIVAGPSLTDLAQRLAQQIKQTAGIALPVIRDDEAVQTPGRYGHLIALGHFGCNKLLERLYFQWYAVVDGAQPGTGGWLLQTVHNPGGQGWNVIIVGGSDEAGVAQAADRLVQVIRDHGLVLPRLHEVSLGQGREAVLARGEQVINPDRVWPTIHPMEVQQAIAEAGMLYVYTGQERFADAYKRQLIGWLNRPDHYVLCSDDFYRTIIVWDLLEESPVFDDAERLWITQRLLDTLRKEAAPYGQDARSPNYNHDAFVQVKDQDLLRENHRARYANSLYFGGRYFRDYYGLPEAKQWMEDARAYWRPQMRSFAPQEADLSIALITMTEATTFALAENVRSYLSPQVLGRIADKGLMLMGSGSSLSPGETPFVMLCLSAYLFDKPEYLWPIYQRDPTMAPLRMIWRNSWGLGRSFWDGTAPKRPDSVDWVQVMPLSEAYFRQAPAHGPRNIEASRSFDFVIFQSPADEDGSAGEHLTLAGHNTGSYSADAANSIAQFMARGHRWLLGGGRVSTADKHTSVAIVRNGQSRALPAFAAIERCEDHGDWGVSRTALLDYNGADWHRNLLAVPGRWYLIIDEVRAREPGDYVLESRWMTPSHAGFDGDDFAAIQGSPQQAWELRLSGVGWQRQYLVPWLYVDYLNAPIRPFPPRVEQLDLDAPVEVLTILARRWSGKLARGQTHIFANLLHVQPHGEAPRFHLQTISDRRFRVMGKDAAWEIQEEASGIWTVQPQPIEEALSASAQDEIPSTAPTSLAAPNLAPRWAQRLNQRILCTASLSLEGSTQWAIGLADGRVLVLDDQGATEAAWEVPGRVLGLAGVDLDGDGRDELIVGGDVCGVRAFTAEGQPLWTFTPPPWKPNPSWRQSMGESRNVITDVLPLRDRDRLSILAFGLYFYVLNADGELRCAYDERAELSFTDLVGVKRMGMWRTAENTLRLAAGDVDGDGRAELVGDVNDPGYNHVRVWSASTGARLAGYDKPPHRFMGNAIRHMLTGDFNGDGRDEFILGADAYHDQLVFYAYPQGLLWSRDVGSAVGALARGDVDADGKPEVIVGTELGHVQAFDAAGRRRFVADVHGPVTALAVAEGHPRWLWVAALDGRLLALDRHGRIVGEHRLGGYVDRVTLSPTGDAVLVSSADGHLARFDTDATSRD